VSKLELSITKLEDVTLRVQPKGYILTLRLQVPALQVGPLWPWMDLQKAGALKLSLESAQLPLPLEEAEESRPDTMEDSHVEIPPAAQEEKAPAAAVNSSKPRKGLRTLTAVNHHLFMDGTESACGKFLLADMVKSSPYLSSDDFYIDICPRCLKVVSKSQVAPETASA